jgi:hypothetical protein
MGQARFRLEAIALPSVRQDAYSSRRMAVIAAALDQPTWTQRIATRLRSALGRGWVWANASEAEFDSVVETGRRWVEEWFRIAETRLFQWATTRPSFSHRRDALARKIQERKRIRREYLWRPEKRLKTRAARIKQQERMDAVEKGDWVIGRLERHERRLVGIKRG